MIGRTPVPAPRHRRRKLAAWPVAACCVALAPAVAAGEPSSQEKGRNALETRCSRCHAIGADGDSPHAQAPPFREVVKRYPPEDLEESLAEGIVSGHPDMPEFILSPDEIADVVSYLHSLTGE